MPPHTSSSPSQSPLLYWGFLVFVCLSPLPLGGYRPLPWSFNAIFIGLLLLIWIYQQLLQQRPAPVALQRLLVPIGLMFSLVTWVMLQSLPLWETFSAAPVWFTLEPLLGPAPSTSVLSANQSASHISLMHLLTNAATFLLAVQLGRSSHRADHMLMTLAMAIAAYALYGLIMHLGGVNYVLWWERWTYTDSVTGTFVNRNHFATLSGLGLTITVALTMRAWRRETSSYMGMSAQFIMEFLERYWLLIFAATGLLSALAFSLSRAGLASSLLAITILSLLLAPQLLRRRWWPWILLILITVLLVFGTKTLSRFDATGVAAEQRGEMFKITLRGIGDAPWTGHGAGSFPDVARQYRDTNLKGGFYWAHAHNTYLEFAFELGLPALLLLLGLMSWVFSQYVLGLIRRRHGKTYPALGIAALILVGSHALVDFSVQLPGVAIPFFALLGICYAQSWPSRES